MLDVTENPSPKASPIPDALEPKLSLYVAILSLITTEKQLIWNRYNAMLVANSFIAVPVGAVFAKSELKQIDHIILLLAIAVGFALSLLWMALTRSGWRWHDTLMAEARSYHWSPLKNPTDIGRESRRRDWIKFQAYAVIWGFLLLYATGLVLALRGGIGVVSTFGS